MNIQALPTIRLRPDILTAHNSYCLPLLSSESDGVHRPLLRKIRSSTPLEMGLTLHITGLRREFNPAIADCGLQDTAAFPSSTANPLYSKRAPKAIPIYPTRSPDVMLIVPLAFQKRQKKRTPGMMIINNYDLNPRFRQYEIR